MSIRLVLDSGAHQTQLSRGTMIALGFREQERPGRLFLSALEARERGFEVVVPRLGADSVSWHANDEPELGERPVIASVSFGGTRTFQLKHKERTDLRASVALPHGRLLILRGGTQADWLHRVAKTARRVEERVNLTFRVIVAPAK